MVRILERLILLAVFPVSAAIAYIALVYQDETKRWPGNKVEERSSTDYIVVHYDSIFRPTTLDEIQHQHHDINGWERGFAYHYFLMDGKVYMTRPINSRSPHAAGYNGNCITVCIHAIHDDFDIFNLKMLIWFLKIKYKIPKERILGHGELPGNATQCPAMDMDSIRSFF